MVIVNLKGGSSDVKADDICSAPSVVIQFSCGYANAGGYLDYLDHIINDVIPCESRWQLDPGGYYLGLAQFDPNTWFNSARSFDADWRNAWEQGFAMANLIHNSDPNSQWPVCWHRGGW